MIPAAVIFPAHPDAAAFDLIEAALAARGAGQRLYTNGRQVALLPRPCKGWALVAARPRAADEPQPPEAA
ncbi:MAG: hypothetical protein H3C26_16045 [Rhodocyclaceae bacterium]|nr:hypothetical protein [Rhodocyclaceae bacterium]